ncbi:sulfate/molybdate ABC transporter ATP-binding protein [uncultured Shewanella sp.]|uniref:sulfate/molybdate ABC transporter ATP-binding protein n=1 Tax=uncultured Shewanella sp. TaxID=173975 RepID=UPI002615F4DA|nr:ABC transporter ATP-binding protein [uncultured Shewanella sp.]
MSINTNIHTNRALYCQIEQSLPIPLKVDFSCEAGKLLAIVGPSGGGKSTLLRVLAGLSLPRTGHIECGGRCLFDAKGHIHMSPAERHVGYVPQHFGLFPHLTALENILAGLDHIPKVARKHRAMQWLAEMNLTHVAHRRPSALSGGQQQRIALARALAREPTLLLLDEPFSAVDWKTREFLYESLFDLKSSLNIPVIMVTHDLKEALLLADNILLMDDGYMLQHGSPQALLSRPTSEIVAKQMGQKNVFDGVVTTDTISTDVSCLYWQGVKVNAAYQASLVQGQDVRWMVSNSGIELYDDLSLAKEPNCFVVTVVSLLAIGDMIRIILSVNANAQRLHLELPVQVVKQLGLMQGKESLAMLNLSCIHIFSSSN